MSHSYSPLVVISGASGSGKTTLCRMVSDELGFYYSVSCTTRSKRPTEKDGSDYYFVTRDEFERMKKKNDFLEWAEVYGNGYGTSRSLVESHLKAGHGVIVDVDTQGALSIKKQCPNAVLIFLLAPSLKELEARLVRRATDSPEIQKMRLAHALAEESHKDQFDHVLINRDLKETFERLKEIIPHI